MPLNGLKSLINGLSSLDLEREQLLLIQQNRDELVLAQTEVLSEGRDRTGQIRPDSYRPMTIEEKAKSDIVGLGRVTDRVTFYMRGNLYRSLEARITAKTYRVESPLETFDKMINRIGPAYYGLDPKRINAFRNSFVITPLRRIIFERTGLGLK